MARPVYGIPFLNFRDLARNDAIPDAGIIVLHRGTIHVAMLGLFFF